MNVRKKRHIASWILLAVFVPMLVMSSLHLHHSQTDITDSCSECVHHHCHGHLLQTDTNSHNCVLCHFLTIPFVAATAVAVIYYNRSINHYALYQNNVHFHTQGIPPMRGPPTLMSNA